MKIALEQNIAYGCRQAIIDNLKDAGCNQALINSVLVDLSNGDTTKLLYKLQTHRNHLLELIHKREKQIDCLDYLVYQIGHCPSKSK